jgi:tRNA G18 (ribose-2'-O)-methylase SpoU
MAIVGDDIENPGNVETLLIAAEMFATECAFHEHAHLSRPELSTLLSDRQARIVSTEQIGALFHPVVALENAPGAADIYTFRPPAGALSALIVGNERRGVSRELLGMSDCAVQIPMQSRHLNCLNAASAAAVGLYYLTRNGGARRPAGHSMRQRPELLFLAPTDHIELGSSIRSAGAFGWDQLLVDDRHGVWFGIQRSLRAEGRAAARRARNPIHVIPSTIDRCYAFDEVCVITLRPGDIPLSRAKLAGGQRQILVIPDVHGVEIDTVDWERFGKQITFVTLDVPHQPAVRRYRLDSSIALAEAARQVGRPLDHPRRKHPSSAPRYDRALRLRMPELGDVVYLEDLGCY